MMDKTGQNPRELPENGYAIYQLKPDPQYHSLRFASLSELRSLSRKKGNNADAALGVTESRYDLVYSGALSPALAANRTPEAILEGLYTRFNLNRPDDFRGHSLSVSDVIALNLNGQTECYYTDSFGFYKLPAFLERENALKNAEMMLEDDYNMIDGIVNNGPKEERAEKSSASRLLNDHDKPASSHTQRIGNTNFTVRAYCDDDIAVTYEDKLLELIRSGVLQADASEKPKEPPAEHAA